MIKFLMDGDIRTIEAIDPTQTVLEWLREEAGKTGTKEGCAEGDCGACTVAIGEVVDGAVRYRAINACIWFMPMLHGKELVTVEALGTHDDLHPVQAALVDEHASQCGFCTPGFAMSLFAKYQQTDPALPDRTDDLLAGNLCRCTGYGPLRKASDTQTPNADIQARFGTTETIDALTQLAGEPMAPIDYADPLRTLQRRCRNPLTESDLCEMLSTAGRATIIAGATDVGLWVTKQDRSIEDAVFIGAIPSLKTITQDEDGLRIGACVSYADALPALMDYHPDLGELLRRIGSVQVRNSGTIGGNIANGSPIGDTMPAFIALGARLTLASKGGARTIALENFFIAYGEQDLRMGEYVQAVTLPPLNRDVFFRCYKISKRFDQDISALCAAFAFEIEDGCVAGARMAFGGMDGVPKRAEACETALIGTPWTEDAVKQAAVALCEDFTPLSDARASRDYRMIVAQNLLLKALLEHQPTARTRILETDRL